MLEGGRTSKFMCIREGRGSAPLPKGGEATWEGGEPFEQTGVKGGGRTTIGKRGESSNCQGAQVRLGNEQIRRGNSIQAGDSCCDEQLWQGVGVVERHQGQSRTRFINSKRSITKNKGGEAEEGGIKFASRVWNGSLQKRDRTLASPHEQSKKAGKRRGSLNCKARK